MKRALVTGGCGFIGSSLTKFKLSYCEFPGSYLTLSKNLHSTDDC